jgi:sarcosine/dimethylglycine N-methyltransferase
MAKPVENMNDQKEALMLETYPDREELDVYYSFLGGKENTHIGIYKKAKETIEKARQNTVEDMIAKLPRINKSTSILDIGSGYGGAARFLVEKFGCKVDCLNPSERENERNRELTEAAELGDKITITTGNFEQIPFINRTYNIIWSQDAMLYTQKKREILWQISRLLEPKGRFIFTDIMQSKDCPKGALDPLLAHLKLKNLASIKKYRKMTRMVIDMEEGRFKSMPEHLVTHFTKVLAKIEENYEEISKQTSKKFIDNKIKEVKLWLDAGEKGYLNWGIMQLQKRNV